MKNELLDCLKKYYLENVASLRKNVSYLYYGYLDI